MKIITSFKDFLEKGTVNSIFIHIRNLVYCGCILAAGSFANANPPEWMLGTALAQYSGWVLIGLGILLVLLNLADGLYRLSKLKHSLILTIIFFVIYLAVSITIVTIVLKTRLQ